MNWKPSRRTENLYAQELIRFFERLLQRSEAEGIPIELLGAADFIANYAKQVATRMVTALYFAGARTWREAAQKSSKGFLIRRALQNELKGPVGARVRELIEENAELISSLPETVALAVSRQAAEKQFAGARPTELIPALMRHVGRSRAKLIARTEVSKASAALTEARSEMLNIPYYIWETSQDERVRRSHRKMQGVLVPFADPPSPEQLVGEHSDGNYNAGNIYNCFPGNTLVDKRYCHSLFRRRYDGPLVDIKTDSTSPISSTTNHPILTLRGWIQASALNKGDKIVEILPGGNPSVLINDDDKQELVMFDDLYRSLSSSSSRYCWPASSFNFYGEVPVHDIHAITADQYLPLNRTNLSDSLADLILGESYSMVRSVISCVVSEILESALYRWLHETLTPIAPQLAHANAVGGTYSSAFNTMTFQEFDYCPTVNSVLFRQGEDADSGNEFVDDAPFRKSDSPMVRPLSDRQIDAMPLHDSSEMPDAESLCDSLVRGTLPHKLHAVVDLRLRENNGSGHVYTLQSPSGYYTVSDNNILVKNCRCYMAPLVRLEQVSWPHRCYLNGRIRSMTLAQFRNLNQFKEAA